MDSLHIAVPEINFNFDPYPRYNRNKTSSMPIPRTTSTSSGNFDPANSYLALNEQPNNTQRRPSAKKGVSSFISKLFSMVEDGRHQSLISWNPSGTSFFVCNATQFSQIVLPEYFKHSNYSSFVRLLNMYGFHKINKSPRGQRGNNENEIWEFSHPKFQHSRADLLTDIKRKAMDSELLRRETGDIHANFAMLQVSQSELLQQFYVLQENFSNLLQNFEENKRIQAHQQAIISQLAQKHGFNEADLLQSEGEETNSLENTIEHTTENARKSSTSSPLAVFVTSPTEVHEPYNPMQFINDYQNTLHHPLQTTTSEVTMSMYDSSNSTSPSLSSSIFNTAMNTSLLPNPEHASMLEHSQNHQHHFQPPSLKFENVNTLGLGLS